MTRSLALLLALCAPLRAAAVRVEAVPSGEAGVAAAARLSSVILNLQSPAAPFLGAPGLALPGNLPVLSPAAFAALPSPAAAARLSAVAQRLAPAAVADIGAAPAAPAALPPDRGGRLPASEGASQPRTEADPRSLSAADELTGVDLKELSAAVEGVMGGLSPAQIGALSDEEFSGGAERILAALEGRRHAGRGALDARASRAAKSYGPATPENVASYLQDVAPGLQALAMEKFGMDHDKPDSFAACGPVSLAAREALREDLRRRFPGSPHIDVLLEPGRLDGPGEPVLHVFLKIVDRTAPTSLLVTPLAVIDLTAAQKPGNLTALGLDPRRQATLILPWQSDIYEKRYPFSRPGGRDGAAMIRRIEAARGPLSRELETRMRGFLSERP